MHKTRVEQILKFALAVAAEEEFGNRELGVIHLLKLLYLADLAYAEVHRGETYIGTPWVFHNFGPWSLEAHQEIEDVLSNLALTPRRIETPRFEVKRYALPPDHRLHGETEELGADLPGEVYFSIKRNVHTFGSDTETMLHYVYKTLPMLNAAPEQVLDFSCVVPSTDIETAQFQQAVEGTHLSKTKAKRKEERRQQLKKEVQAKIQERIQERQSNHASAPIDSEFIELLTALNQEDDHDPVILKGKLHFDQSIWDGDFRRECGLS